MNSSSGKVAERPAAGASMVPRATSMVISSVGSSATAASRASVELGGDLHREQALLGAVVAEDVGETRGDHGLEAVVHQRPHGMLPRRAGAEVVARHQDVGADVLGVVEHEVSVVAPFGEEAGAEPGALDSLEPVRRNDLVGVDVGTVEGDRTTGDDDDGLHQSRSSGVANVPATAVAAATVGETRWVRPPRP